MGIKRKIVSVALCLIMMLSCINVNVIDAKANISNSDAHVSDTKDINGNSITDETYLNSLNTIKNTIENNSYQWTSSDGKLVTNIPITNWTRSSNYISYTRKTSAGVQNDWNWTTVNSLNNNYTNPYQVWDSSRNTSHYCTLVDVSLKGSQLSMYNNSLYDGATWIAPNGKFGANVDTIEDIYKFEGSFNIDKTYDVSNLYFTLSTVASNRIIYLNDNIYVFIYPTCLKNNISNDSSSPYYFMNYMCYWTGTIGTVAGVNTFNGVRCTTAYNNLTRFSDLTEKESALNFTSWNMDALKNNVGNAINYGYNLAKNMSAYNGDYTITVVTSDISGGGGMYRPILGVELKNTSIVYVGNGSTSGSTSTQNKNYGTDLIISNNGYSKEGYTFKEWNTKADGTGISYQPGDKFPVESGAILYAQWTPNKYKNRYDHWAWGFTNSEGNNGTKNAFKLQTTYGEETYGEEFTPDATYGLTVPNGFYLAPRFGNGQITGEWTTFNFGTKLTQPSYVMNFEYDYYPTDYTITYNLNGGTNSNSNPSTYNVLYGVTFGTPTKKGYDFVGWYDSKGNKITGINEDCNATFSDTADMYSKLKIRTTGDISVTAKWQIHDYSIITKETGSGVISNDSKIIYLKNTSVFIVPAEGYTTSSLKIDGVSVTPVTKYNFLNVEKDHTVEATFSITQNKKMELIQKGYSWIDLKL